MSHAWLPVSRCGDSCLSEVTPVAGLPRRAARWVRAVAVLLFAAVVGLLPGRRGRGLVFRAALCAFGVRLVVHGGEEFRFAPEGRGALVVSNHISWLDIIAINAIRPMSALAKREVANWPLLGRLIAGADTVFLDRARLSTLRGTVAELAARLRAGDTVAVTPEATTYCGLASGPFTTATFQAAIDGGVPVRPLALRYRLGDGRQTTAPAFIGAESLLASVRRVLRLRGLVVEVFVGAEIAPGRAGTRRELAALAESSVRSALGTTHVPTGRYRSLLPGRVSAVTA